MITRRHDPRFQARWLAPLAVLLLTLPAMAPYLLGVGYPETHDGHFHLYRLLSLRDAWGQGHYYPRLFPDFAFGYGFAVLNFYGPLTYYVALLISALLEPVTAMKVTFVLSYPLAALAMWWLVRDLWRTADGRPGEAAGLYAGVVYTYLPYHMADVQVRGALAESWAFVWWPLIFYAVWRGRPLPLALSLAALVLTHNLSVVLVALPLALWALVAVARSESPRRHLLRLIGGTLVAAAVSAFYWLPVLLEGRYIWISQHVGGLGFLDLLAGWREMISPNARYQYATDPVASSSYALSWPQLLLMLLTAVGSPAVWKRGPRDALVVNWLTLAGALVLLLAVSAPVWRLLVFPLGLVQYPWRWLGPVALATAPLAGTIFILPRGAAARLLQGAAIIGVVWLSVSTLQALPWTTRPLDIARHPVEMWENDAAFGQVGATWMAEFLPLTVEESRWEMTTVPEQVAGVGVRAPLDLLAVGGDGFTLAATVEAASPTSLIFPRFAYPSMRATIDGRPVRLEVQGALGLAAVALPAGRHEVVLETQPLAAWGWLRHLLWLPPLLFGLWLLRKSGRHGLIVLPVAALLLLLPAAPPRLKVLAAPIPIGEQVDLGGARLGARARPGGPLPVTLIWLNRVQTDRRYNTFVHLTPPGGGPPLAQSDGEPNGGMVPTPRWRPGQMVEDLHLLTVPPDLPPGSYEIRGGIYEVRDGQASPLPGAAGLPHLLGTIQIEP